MKIRMTAQAFTTQGLFEPGQELSSDDYDEAFLVHLARDAKAAEIIEHKMLEPVEENKAETKPKKPLPKKKVTPKKKSQAQKKPSSS